MSNVLSRVLLAGAGALAAAAVAAPITASGEPAPPPPVPDVNALPLVSPVDYSVLEGRYFAWSTADGLSCAFDRNSGAYGCSGPIPAAPGGANVVSGGAVGGPGFASSARPIFEGLGALKELPANTRISFRTVSCTTDGAATTMCVNAQDQSGFVLTPSGSFVLNHNPLVARPEGTNPYAN